MFVVFVQFESTEVDIYNEVITVWKIDDGSLCGFETLKKKFVRMDKVPACTLEKLTITIRWPL